jgi:hypothetical protein
MKRTTVAVVLFAVTLLAVTSGATAMNSEFNSPLKLTANGQHVQASGPLAWDSGDVSADIVITISQGDAQATGEGEFASPATEWQLTLTSTGSALEPGSAVGHGVTYVQTASGATETYRWSTSLTLN